MKLSPQYLRYETRITNGGVLVRGYFYWHPIPDLANGLCFGLTMEEAVFNLSRWNRNRV